MQKNTLIAWIEVVYDNVLVVGSGYCGGLCTLTVHIVQCNLAPTQYVHVGFSVHVHVCW